MKNGKSFGRVGRGLLLGVAVGALPLAGCTELPPAPKQTVITVPAKEKRLYDRAHESADPAVAT